MNKKTCKFTLTIITVTYNAEKELKKTIESILSQQEIQNIKVEYIIQDGLSNDKTLTVASRYKTKLEDKGIGVNIYSETDSGIYDAMNKGIRKANGKWICLLNAGDCFCNEKSLLDVQWYLETSSSDVLYTDYKRINSYIEKKIEIPKLDELMNMMIFCHQALFVRNYIYKKYSYDCKYKLVADYDLMLRLYLDNIKFEHISLCLIDYDVEGVSAKNMLRTYKEIYQVREDNGVIRNKIFERLKYLFGMAKRFILVNMPQKLRWKIYRILNRI